MQSTHYTLSSSKRGESISSSVRFVQLGMELIICCQGYSLWCTEFTGTMDHQSNTEAKFFESVSCRLLGFKVFRHRPACVRLKSVDETEDPCRRSSNSHKFNDGDTREGGHLSSLRTDTHSNETRGKKVCRKVQVNLPSLRTDTQVLMTKQKGQEKVRVNGSVCGKPH